jgi:hypothetical protein
MRNVGRALRGHGRQPCANAWRAYLETLGSKEMAIKNAKAAHFKQAVAEATRGRREM